MNYTLIKLLITMVERFEVANENGNFTNDIPGFWKWLLKEGILQEYALLDPNWDGKENGRTPECVIATMIVYMNRYASAYSKSAIYGSPFSTQEEFIYLSTLQAYGEMTKMELIYKNTQNKSSGRLIINRLITQGWVAQVDSQGNKRSKVLQLTPKGEALVVKIKKSVDKSTQLEAGDLTRMEQLELVRLLQKMADFHQPMFLINIDRAKLLDKVTAMVPSNNN